MLNSTSTSTLLRVFALAAYCWTLALAGPRYIAIPIDGVDVIELNPIGPGGLAAGGGPRIARQTEAYVPVAMPGLQQPGEAVLEQTVQLQPARPERATAHILDYVDFGAHTGPNGAFSWYADYPSHH